MAEKTASQSQHDRSQSQQQGTASPTSFPFAFPQLPFPSFQGGVEAMKSAQEEWVKLEVQGLERARQAIDELARLGHASLAYAAQLSAESRRLTTEATQRALDLVG